MVAEEMEEGALGDRKLEACEDALAGLGLGHRKEGLI